MLVLSRKLGDKIYIGDNIVIQLVDIRRNQVRLGIEAPKELYIERGENRVAREKEGGKK